MSTGLFERQPRHSIHSNAKWVKFLLDFSGWSLLKIRSMFNSWNVADHPDRVTGRWANTTAKRRPLSSTWKCPVPIRITKFHNHVAGLTFHPFSVRSRQKWHRNHPSVPIFTVRWVEILRSSPNFERFWFWGYFSCKSSNLCALETFYISKPKSLDQLNVEEDAQPTF